MTKDSVYELIMPKTPDVEIKSGFDEQMKKEYIETINSSKSTKRFDGMSSSEERAKDIIHQIKRMADFESYNAAWIRFESNDTLLMDELDEITDLFSDFEKCIWCHNINPFLIKELLCVSFVLMKV